MRLEGRQTLNHPLSAVAALLVIAFCGTATAVTVNENGTVDEYEWHHFGPFETDAAGIVADMTGSGDADLYIREGAQPTTGTYDCKSDGWTTNEYCSVSGAGSYYVSVYGYDWWGSDYDLTISYEPPGPPPPTPTDVKVMFISGESAPQELDIEARLMSLGFNVTTMRDNEFNSSTDLNPYSLVVLTEYEPFLYNSAKNHIKNSGLPVLIVSYWDHAYAQDFDLIEFWVDCDDEWGWDECESWGVDDVWPANTSHEIIDGLASPFVALSPSTTVYDVDDSDLENGVTPLVFSNSYRNRAVAAIDESRRYAYTGLNDTTKYTADAWTLFDKTVLYLYGGYPSPACEAGHTKALLVSNDEHPDERSLENHLNGLGDVCVTRVRDANMYATTDLGEYDVFFLTGYSPGVSPDALQNIIAQGKPTIVVSHGDHAYAQAFGIVAAGLECDPASGNCVSGGIEDVYLPNSGYDFVSIVGKELMALSAPSDTFDFDVSELTAGVEPIVSSVGTGQRILAAVNNQNKVVVTGLSSFENYTTEGWILFDLLLERILPHEVERATLLNVLADYYGTGIMQFLDDVEAEVDQNPGSWTYEEALWESWIIVRQAGLRESWLLTTNRLDEIFGDGIPIPITYFHRQRPHGSGLGFLTDPNEEEFWFLGEYWDANNQKALPPEFGSLHTGTDLGFSVEYLGKTFVYMGDTWGGNWSTLNCDPAAKCNDMIVEIDDSTGPDDGIDVIIPTEMDGGQQKFIPLTIPGIHTDFVPEMTGFWTAGQNAPAFTVPTGAVVAHPTVTFAFGQQTIDFAFPMIMVWYGTAINPGQIDSTNPKRRPTSWAGCSIDGYHFWSCFFNDQGEAIPFSIDVSPGGDGTADGKPARFIQVEAIDLTPDDFDEICAVDGSNPLCTLDDPSDDLAERGGLLLYGNGRPYRKSGLFLAYMANKTMLDMPWEPGAGGGPEVVYWDGTGWSSDEDSADSIVHPGAPPCDTYTAPADCTTLPPPVNLPWNETRVFGEMSTKLVRAPNAGGKVFLLNTRQASTVLSQLGGTLPVQVWKFPLLSPWSPDPNSATDTLTSGYGPCIIDTYSDDTYPGSGPNGEVVLYHLISTWGFGPYGVYSGKEIIEW
jgi:hypothetical protein